MSERYITVEWSDFARKHSRPGTGNSYTTLSDQRVIDLVLDNWSQAVPGAGETDTSRKVLIPVPVDGFFCPPRADLVMGMPVNAEIVQRQAGEDPYLETSVTRAVAEAFGALREVPARRVDIVCYSAAALLENDGKRSSDASWEIVTILCNEDGGDLPMIPLAMARNQLEKPGGTKGEYTALEYAEAIWYHSTKKGIKVKG